MPIAFNRAPSPLKPDAGGVEPVNFYRLVKPVFDDNCVSCHREQYSAPDMNYQSLEDYAFWWPGPGNPYVNGDIVTAKHGGSRTIPGKFGALASPLLEHLGPEHHDVSLSEEEMRRITLWLDCNSNELGAYTKVYDQKSGKLVWPQLDCDPDNPTGVENKRPLPGTSQIRKNLSPYLKKETVMQNVRARINICRRMLTLSHCGAGHYKITFYNPSGRQLWRTNISSSFAGTVTVPDVPRLGSGMVIVCIESSLGTKTIQPMRIIR
jgi:hypothetical protein